MQMSLSQHHVLRATTAVLRAVLRAVLHAVLHAVLRAVLTNVPCYVVRYVRQHLAARRGLLGTSISLLTSKYSPGDVRRFRCFQAVSNTYYLVFSGAVKCVKPVMSTLT